MSGYLSLIRGSKCVGVGGCIGGDLNIKIKKKIIMIFGINPGRYNNNIGLYIVYLEKWQYIIEGTSI